MLLTIFENYTKHRTTKLCIKCKRVSCTETTGEICFSHFHTGFNGGAANGKSKSFELMAMTYGNYITKIDVSVLVCGVRQNKGTGCRIRKSTWKGVRVLYTSEPNPEESTIHSGIMKELTGGEIIKYRLLNQNEYHEFKPMFKVTLCVTTYLKLMVVTRG